MSAAMETAEDTTIKGVSKDILHDLCSRFLINIPEEERKDIVRICFQIELAHWFYLDFYRQEDPQLPGYGLQQFMELIFHEFPFLNKEGANFQDIFSNWKKYKYEVPVYGAIMLDELLEKCVLVRGYIKRISWGFPKGKVNKDEDSVDCAVREVKEETGFDVTGLIDSNEFLEWNFHDHRVCLYIVPFVPLTSIFEPKTRGEIKDIRWFPIDALPLHKKDTTPRDCLGLNASSFFMVQPFVKDLRKWVSNKKSTLRSITSQDSFPLSTGHNFSALPPILNSKESEDRLLKRKLEEQRKFQEIQLSNHPLLEDVLENEKKLKDLFGFREQSVRAKKKAGKEKKGNYQPEAIRKLLDGTVDVSPSSLSESQPSRGFGLPPGYLENKKQTEKDKCNSSVMTRNEKGKENYISLSYPSDELELQDSTKEGLIQRVIESKPEPRSSSWSQFDQITRMFALDNGKNIRSTDVSNSNANLPSRGWYNKVEAGSNQKQMKNEPKESMPGDAIETAKTKWNVEKKSIANQLKGKNEYIDAENCFNFVIPEFLHFKFDTKALLETLPLPL